MENLQMMIQGSKGANESGGSSKDEKNDTSNGVSGEGLIVCWNKFLPFRSLRVLLVESDDSTRHVVTALMKKCGYEVIAVANGLQAWKVLEDRNNHVDIVLTEVVLPYLTGLGLLRKIMNHETRKNLPVIMMSPTDSLGVVFKCLSKGATDFLVKPIRKNELRTLWQHVWRKCLSSSGGGSVAESEAVTRSNALVKSPVTGKSGSSSNDGNVNVPCDPNNRSHGLSDRNGSDQGSGTQEPKDNRKGKPAESDPPLHKWDLNHSAGELEGHDLGDKTIGEDSATKVKHSGEKMGEVLKAASKGRSVQGLLDTKETAIGKKVVIGEAHMTATPIKNVDAPPPPFGEMGSKQSENGKGNGGKAARHRNVLGHSSHSAFSRYGSASKTPNVQSCNEGSCSPPEDGSQEPYPNSDEQPINASTSVEPVSKANGSSGDTTLDRTELSPHHYHPYHNHHFYGHNNMQQLLKASIHGDTTMNDVAAQFTGTTVMRNLNRPGAVNPMSDAAGIVYGFMNGIAANCQLQRLAAIHKFRQKRKDRCFGKKVRCEGRKMIADQRPRMKGQFVRRTDISNSNGAHIC